MAPRPLIRAWTARGRGAWIGLCLGLVVAGRAFGCPVAPHGATQMPESLSAPWGDGVLAWYDGPTTRYAHGVLGDAIEGTRLHAYGDGATTPCGDQTVTLPDALVFEDTAPRLMDLDRDGRPEIIVVQSHRHLGAQLAIYGFADDGEGLNLIATTPFIGRSNRWLAPVGAADLDGDGRMEIAYIDRPHLARTLRVWRFVPGGAAGQGQLVEVAALDGLTNHRIGEPFITGGIRTCGATPEVIIANTEWTQVMAAVLSDGTLTARPLGPFSRDAVARALACQL